MAKDIELVTCLLYARAVTDKNMALHTEMGIPGAVAAVVQCRLWLATARCD